VRRAVIDDTRARYETGEQVEAEELAELLAASFGPSAMVTLLTDRERDCRGRHLGARP
jgi:hypothetical protein